MAVSIRLTKKLATLATASRSPPRATSALEPGDVGLGDPLVGVLGEEQRHVDVDALADQLLDGGHALGGRRAP